MALEQIPQPKQNDDDYEKLLLSVITRITLILCAPDDDAPDLEAKSR